MTRRERLMATLRGEPVDRAPVSFYEIDGTQDRDDTDPFNIFSHPSWRPLLDIARDRSDRMAMCGPRFKDAPPDPAADRTSVETWIDEDGSRHTRTTVQAGGRTLTSHTRRDPDVWTVWTLEHLLEDADDLRAWLELPEQPPRRDPDAAPLLAYEKKMGEGGILSIDTGDPICDVAGAFDLGMFTVVATTEPELLHRALERAARQIVPEVEAFAAALPGRHWRICGPEYASPPYLRPELFREYVVRYDTPIVEAIRRHGGLPRLHCHGRLEAIFDGIVATGCMGTDPVEPPPQGDIKLARARERAGDGFVLFGNLEASDLETLPTDAFAEKIRTALRDGPDANGSAFVLMPSSCPYGRELSPLALRNYQKMIELAEEG